MLEIAKKYFEENGMEKFTCCICGCDFYDYTGCNPDPVVTDEDAVCCHECDRTFVWAARSGKKPGEIVYTHIPFGAVMTQPGQRKYEFRNGRNRS